MVGHAVLHQYEIVILRTPGIQEVQVTDCWHKCGRPQQLAARAGMLKG